MVTASQDPNALVIRPEQAARDPNEMAAEDVEEAQMFAKARTSSYYLQEFILYQTQSKLYMIGTDKSKTVWRVLKIDRSELSELNIQEDSTTYSESECKDLLRHIDEGNQITGGLKFVTRCFGIVGFIKFLGPYYMLLITERRQIGSICGHTIYAVTRSKMIAIPNSSILSSVVNSKDEIRYKKLLCTMDLTKDFFFSYSYHIMNSLQKNVCHNQTGKTMMHETMFVWNEFLTRDIQNLVQNTLWTVALVYGFFKQEKLSVYGKDFNLTLIGRRSRHYAGTRYLKRGVNEKGRVANDVETEQIVFEEISGGVPTNISSVVQNRGSIPLFWSQETSKLNLKPDIVLHKKDKDYEATRLHFENLAKRYGHPIIILNLIKSEEKRKRESILRSEFAHAIEFINKDSCEESKLKFLHWDLHKHSRSNAKAVLTWLGLMATNILNITGFFHCEVTPVVLNEGPVRWPVIEVHDAAYWSSTEPKNDNSNNTNNTDDSDMSEDLSQEDNTMCSNERQHEIMEIAFNNSVKPLRLQNGVLRTNCIDCLDRTNVAQYSFGLAALEQQLHALNLISIPRIDLDDPIADDLMKFYETMGDTLALQYGGSAAHNKIFSERRGQWRAATQSQEFFRTLQRYYNNAYMDAEKQAAINLFLGYFQPQEGKPAIWELDPDQHCNLGKTNFADENPRSLVKRSLSDGNVLHESNTSLSGHDDNQKRHASDLSDSTPNISTCPNDVLFIRSTPAMSRRQFFGDTEFNHFYESGDSNFLDLDSLSSSGNSCDEEVSDRSTAMSTPSENLSTENVIGVDSAEATSTAFENASSLNGEHPEMQMTYDATQKTIMLREFSDRFVHWVLHGETMSDLNC